MSVGLFDAFALLRLTIATVIVGELALASDHPDSLVIIVQKAS
jgi:hypothetical protein